MHANLKKETNSLQLKRAGWAGTKIYLLPGILAK